jgi:acyl-CoA synthetase (AMP-forming)/AMP-acid ligase II
VSAVERAAQVTTAEVLRRNAARHPRSVALRFEEREITYRELADRAGRLAAALTQRGIGPGDRVAVCLHNRPEMVEALFAIHQLGAVAVPVNFRLSSDEVGYQLDHCAARGFICEANLRDSFGEFDTGFTLDVGGDGDGSFEAAIDAAPSGNAAPVVSDGLAAFVIYTSGTTGRPKGAVLTHKNLLVNSWSWMYAMGIQPEDSWYSPAPLFHIGGLVGLYPFLLAGRPCTIEPTGGFDPERSLDRLARAKASMCFFVPAQWQTIVALPEAADRLKGLRRGLWGAAPASRPLLEVMVDVLPRGSVASTFGQTEVTANATFLTPAHALDKIGSVGLPAMTVEHRVVDADDADVERGEVGEIVYRGPTVMTGYLDDAEATAEAFRGGWFHSGDLVREDEDGFLYVVDRVKDLIISGGENVYPAEVERVLVDMPEVADVAVVGVPDQKWGEVPVACIVPSGDRAPGLDDVRTHCGGRLARYKHPVGVREIHELPRNAGGKVLKRTLRAELLAEREVDDGRRS